MKSTLDVLLETHQPKAKAVGGHYLNAVIMFEKALSRNFLLAEIQDVVDKHKSHSKKVGGNLEDFIDILEKFTQ